ncbi:hypothetical protein [Streptomyces vinaceus]
MMAVVVTAAGYLLGRLRPWRRVWEKELENIFLNDLEIAWNPRMRLSR